VFLDQARLGALLIYSGRVMLRILPSDAVRVIDQWFPWAKGSAEAPKLNGNDIGKVEGVIAVLDAVRSDLLTLDPGDYADFVAELAIIRSRPALWLANPKMGRSGRQIQRIRALLTKCPDDIADADSHELSFIADTAIRESLRLDVSHANRAREAGHWKAATVLAGSVMEAVLLWALNKKEKKMPGTASAAVVKLKLIVKKDSSLNDWGLHRYVALAGALGMISDDSLTEAILA
jgi:hypothetical protein